MGKGGVAVAAQKKRDESYTVAEPAAGGSLKRVRRPPTACARDQLFGVFNRPFSAHPHIWGVGSWSF